MNTPKTDAGPAMQSAWLKLTHGYNEGVAPDSLTRAEGRALLEYLKALDWLLGCTHPAAVDSPMCFSCEQLLTDTDRAAAKLLKEVGPLPP